MAERQSPVDIPPTAPIRRDGLELPYGPIPLVLGQNPTAVQVDCTRETAIHLDGTRYELVQFHIHCPSEHTFGGTHAAMELHLVHRSAEGLLAVVAVTFVEGLANPALQRLLDALAAAETAEATNPPAEIDLAGLLPRDRAHVAYDGSLTTPPYTEGVAWRVLIRASTLSAEQLLALESAFRGNNRPTQPFGERLFKSSQDDPNRA